MRGIGKGNVLFFYLRLFFLRFVLFFSLFFFIRLRSQKSCEVLIIILKKRMGCNQSVQNGMNISSHFFSIELILFYI